MRLFYRNGVQLESLAQHAINGQTLPAGWLLTAGDEALSIFGITYEDVPDPEPEPQPEPQPTPRTMAPRDFRALFTEMETVALTEAARTNTQLAIFLDEIGAATYINMDDPALMAGVQYVVSVGLLTQQRADEIMSWGLPA